MSAEPTANLIQKCLDGATPAERAELARRLADRAVLREFVVAARLDCQLRTYWKEASKTAQGRAVVHMVRTRPQRGRLAQFAAHLTTAAAAVLLLPIILALSMMPRPTLPTSAGSLAAVSRPATARAADDNVAAAVAIFGMVTVNAVK